MKKIIQLIIIVAIIIIVVVKTPLLSRAAGIIYSSPCDSPIDYRVGFVDPQFHVSKKEFLTAIQQAEYIWEKNIGKNVFQYNEKENALSINLVFDERQSLTNKITSLEGK